MLWFDVLTPGPSEEIVFREVAAVSSEHGNSRSLNLLVTSAGRRCELMDCFRSDANQLGIDLRIFAADLNPQMSPASHHADQAFMVGRCTHENYPHQILELCRANHITLVVPTIDTELQIFADHIVEFQQAGVHVVVSSSAAVRACRDKAETSRILAQAGVPVPRTVLLSEFDPQTFAPHAPLILKPIGGSSSVGIERLSSSAKIPSKPNPQAWILQDYIDGEEFTVNVFVNAQGQLVSAIPHLRQEIRAGEVSKGTTQAIPALQDMATRIAAALPGLRGPFCFQAKRDVSGAFYVFEINARFGGGFPLAHRAGGQFSRWLIEAHFGLPSTETSNWQAGWTFLRYDQAVYFQS